MTLKIRFHINLVPCRIVPIAAGCRVISIALHHVVWQLQQLLPQNPRSHALWRVHGQSQERSLYATPLLVGQVPHTHNDATPTPYLTPSVQSTNRRLPPPPHYEDVKDLSRGVQHDSEFVDSFPLQISSHQRALKYDIHPYAITQSSEITLISETEV